ncbi:uncharacterized protein Z518_05509 [Rhinocladiella mackenziei CBS 650.93]|uniref:Uncharacterized protein n=1 Tax=Rhinocladiella mackenziei CBS 650.93 TaxID=1442369 RepID=A0A0D2IFQ1_9EURO|nr:uncharacterized protein Z518_05509 [Rhinocladiella mackenziei CBS 650.93]KIX04639.1 hypothetical protein Z518_05509 [Rhinocladiella mackenziei CBS 650.93]
MLSKSPNVFTPELTPSPSVTSSPSLPPTPDHRPLDLVIAHYNESLAWLSSCSRLATIYSKGDRPQTSQDNSPVYREVKALPNWGRESHTYLHHIVHNYDNLAEVTLFLQGNIHDENNGTPSHTDLTLDEIVGMAKRLTDLPPMLVVGEDQLQYQPQGGVLPLGKVNTFSDWDAVVYKDEWVERRGRGLIRSKYTPKQFWNYIFNGATREQDASWAEPPTEVRWTQGALFAVTRQTIQRRPKEVYQRMYEYFDGLMERNPEEGHYMERFWLSIFGSYGLDTQILGDPQARKEEHTGHNFDFEDEGIFLL